MGVKNFDMPEGNGFGGVYTEFMAQANANRGVAVIFCTTEDGRESSYVYSAKVGDAITKDNCLTFINRGYTVAGKRGFRPSNR